MAWKSHHEEEERKVGFIFEEMMREKVGFIENTAMMFIPFRERRIYIFR